MQHSAPPFMPKSDNASFAYFASTNTLLTVIRQDASICASNPDVDDAYKLNKDARAERNAHENNNGYRNQWISRSVILTAGKQLESCPSIQLALART